ncbi:SAC3/GANP/Nin1/mts3/eIF-3 p25 family-domain-containing protein, partial [Trichophaea hybrida]
ERTKRRARLIKEGSIDNPAVPKYLDQAIKFHGTCNSMCPEFECLQRRYQKMVDSFELVNQSLFAKSFHRPAAGMDAPLPEDVRTPKALVDTLRYLVFEIVMNTPWHECHGFVRDRTRSIRQDFTYQNYEGEEAVICTEIIARFHILALHMMSGQPDNQEYMELEQLDKSLTTLGFIYLDGQIPDADQNRKGFPNEPEFRAYTILRHLRDRYVEKDDIRKWPAEVVYSDRVQHALRIYQAVQRYDRATNYGFHAQHYVKTFFELVKSKETDFITACLLQVYFPEIRRFSLKIMAENYMKTSKMTSVEFIKDFLCYESVEQAEHEIRHYGLSIAEHSADGVPFFYLIPGKGSFDGMVAIVWLADIFLTVL